MSWLLHVLIIAGMVNGQPVYTHAIVRGPVEFATFELCAAHGIQYVAPTTRVICDQPATGQQAEVKAL